MRYNVCGGLNCLFPPFLLPCWRQGMVCTALWSLRQCTYASVGPFLLKIRLPIFFITIIVHRQILTATGVSCTHHLLSGHSNEKLQGSQMTSAQASSRSGVRRRTHARLKIRKIQFTFTYAFQTRLFTLTEPYLYERDSECWSCPASNYTYKIHHMVWGGHR